MSQFSERMGIKPVKSVLQVDSMDDALRNGLWNMLIVHYWDKLTWSQLAYDSDLNTFCRRLWHMHFRRSLDEIPELTSIALDRIKTHFYDCDWHEVYDFLEFFVSVYPDTEGRTARFVDSCNTVLQRELSAYRFVNGEIAPLTSEQEIAEIEEALALTGTLSPVTYHLKDALGKLADRQAPDYRNSIKESILAVEALCQLITGDTGATLGQALKVVEDAVGLHGALKAAFSSLYGYTSAAEGIRHALLEQASLDFEDAKFMLVACSAFVNYLVTKGTKAGIEF